MVSTVASQKGLGFKPRVEPKGFLPDLVLVWAFSGLSSFRPQSKNICLGCLEAQSLVKDVFGICLVKIKFKKGKNHMNGLGLGQTLFYSLWFDIVSKLVSTRVERQHVF